MKWMMVVIVAASILGCETREEKEMREMIEKALEERAKTDNEGEDGDILPLIPVSILAECEQKAHELEGKHLTINRVPTQRPDEELDIVGECLYSVDRVFGDRFNENRHKFFFECLDAVVAATEGTCCYKNWECEMNLHHAQNESKECWSELPSCQEALASANKRLRNRNCEEEY